MGTLPAALFGRKTSVDIVCSRRSCLLVHGQRKYAAATCLLEQTLKWEKAGEPWVIFFPKHPQSMTPREQTQAEETERCTFWVWLLPDLRGGPSHICSRLGPRLLLRGTPPSTKFNPKSSKVKVYWGLAPYKSFKNKAENCQMHSPVWTERALISQQPTG